VQPLRINFLAIKNENKGDRLTRRMNKEDQEQPPDPPPIVRLQEPKYGPQHQASE